MGRRGPPPQPDALKKAKGTFQPCRSTAGKVLEMPPGMPERPRMPAPARAKWDELAPRLFAAGVLAEVDGGTLEAYCRTFARWSALDAEAAKNQMVAGAVNPAALEARKLLHDVLAPLETALGLHYTARSRVKPPEKPKEQDEEEAAMFGGPLQVVAGGKTGG